MITSMAKIATVDLPTHVIQTLLRELNKNTIDDNPITLHRVAVIVGVTQALKCMRVSDISDTKCRELAVDVINLLPKFTLGYYAHEILALNTDRTRWEARLVAIRARRDSVTAQDILARLSCAEAFVSLTLNCPRDALIWTVIHSVNCMTELYGQNARRDFKNKIKELLK